ncbi:MAG: hypothetical protein E2O82_03730 [Betaproteobacteria bacterium]|nr:MAG: hypothetical protein E2O82_03730 [Betaproteobacteria bacterium]
MAVLDPIQAKYAELVELFNWWIPAYVPDANTFLVGQSTAKIPNPCVAYNPIVSVDFVGHDERRVIDGNEVLRGQRTITCDLYGFSDSATRFDGEITAWDMLQALRFSLGFPEVVERFGSVNCRILDEGTVSNVSQTLNTTNEPRAVLQFMLSTVIIQSIDSGVIENIEGSVTLQGSTEEFDSNYSVSKP